MARTALYSPSPRQPPPSGDLPKPDEPATVGPDPAAKPQRRLAHRLRRHRRTVAAIAMLALVVAAGWPAWTAKVMRPLTLAQIDAALRESIARQPLASAAAAAYEAILPSVVRVEGEAATRAGSPATAGAAGRHGKPEASGRSAENPAGQAGPRADGSHADDGHSVGTGVVIVDKGLILTSLHVVDGAQRIHVTFADGSRSLATVVNRQPENDLAVLQAHTLPDDLHPATLRSTAGLVPGEAVLAVGFPFGIGPSASLGVVSGLEREFRTPEGQRILTHLIQFDAAANPGNSGGPLVTMDGHVVGIVAAIMNPNRQRTFIGIGFAVPIENAAAAVGMPPF